MFLEPKQILVYPLLDFRTPQNDHEKEHLVEIKAIHSKVKRIEN
jgi:hypothetical protein